MSKMGNYNLVLQEQANKLGFSTTQEALDNGYHVVEDLVAGDATLKKLSIDEQYEQSHKAWLAEKSACLAGLVEASAYTNRSTDYTAIKRAIKFIEGVKYEQ